MGTRTSFRPRPVDINRPLPIVRDLADLDSQDAANGGGQDKVRAAMSREQEKRSAPDHVARVVARAACFAAAAAAAPASAHAPPRARHAAVSLHTGPCIQPGP